MFTHPFARTVFIVALAGALLALGGCHVVGGGVRVEAEAGYPPPPAHHPAPPPHAPAYGVRRHYHYYYYPEVSIYFDTRRGVYFYLSGDRWISTVTLPRHLRGRLSGHVELDLDTPEPWREYRRHRHAYPPGYFKKKKKKHKKKKERYDDD